MEIKNGVTPQNIGVKKSFFANVKEKALDVVDIAVNYTKPRADTAGNFEKASYFQAILHGAKDGFCIFGVPGAVQGSLSAVTSIAATRFSGKSSIGVICGVATGVAISGAAAALTGGAVVPALIGGGLMGAIGAFRGDANAVTRDGCSNANMLAAVLLPGPAKLAAGIGSGIATKVNGTAKQAVIGGLSAGAIGGALALIGFAPVSLPLAVAGSAIGGALGPSIGNWAGTAFRNLSADIGHFITKGLKKLHILKDKPQSGESSQISDAGEKVIGTLPLALAKESVKAYLLADGDLTKVAFSAICSAIDAAHVFLMQKKEAKVKIHN